MTTPRMNLIVCVMLGVCALGASVAQAQQDTHAIDALFDRQHLPGSAVQIVRRTKTLNAQERFDSMTDWILPSAVHRDLRVAIGFEPQEGAASAKLVSPVLEWIDSAIELGRAKQLDESIASISIASEEDWIGRQALRTILAMRNDDAEIVDVLATLLSERLFKDPALIDQQFDTILLCLHVAQKSPQTARLMVETGQQLVTHCKEIQFRESRHQHLKSIVARLREIVHAAEFGTPVLPEENAQWKVVSRSSSLARGLGYPRTQWRFSDKGVRNVSSHGEDFAFFAFPLQGDYDIEADVTGFNWQDSQMMTAGNWVAPIYDHKSLGYGNVRGEQFRLPLSKPMSDTSGTPTIHYRTSVRQLQGSALATTYFNGRAVHRVNYGKHVDPWIAIRSSPVHDGGADDVRITGGEIPKSLLLSDIPGLPGWFEHYSVPWETSLKKWTQVATADSGDSPTAMEIVGARDQRLRKGCFSENAIQYIRPMLEDGSISYDFFYSPGTFMVHPLVGRDCFMIDDSGVRIHQLTDGVYDRTTTRPDQKSQNQSDPIKTQKVKLNADQWNRVSLKLVGNELSVHINQSHRFSHTLADDAVKQFGFFHFNDQTTARVRNVRWTGAWGTELPSLDEQTLASPPHQMIPPEEVASWNEFSHEVSDQSLSSNQLLKYSGDPLNHFRASEDGIVVGRLADGGYSEARLSPSLIIEGDFDVTARFDSLVAKAIDGPLAGISLEVICNDGVEHQASLRLKTEDDGDQGAQCAMAKLIEGERRTEYFGGQVIDAGAGRLRLSRRGSKIFYLFAENDSAQFRILGSREFTSGKLVPGGVRFGVQVMGKTSFVESRWTNFDVRSEKLTDLAIKNVEETIADLNNRRAKLSESMTFDLSKAGPPQSDFYRWGDKQPWDKELGGLQIMHVGTDDWNSSGLALMHELRGDFDVSVEIDSVQLAAPKPKQYSRLFLQAELMDAGQSQINTILGKINSDRLIAQSQTRIADEKGNQVYRDFVKSDGTDVQRLRLIRHGKTLICAVGTDPRDADRILSTTVISDAPLRRGSLRIMVHTGGAGRTSRIRLKSIDVRAEKIPADDRAFRLHIAPIPDVLQEKSIIESFFDLF